MNRQLRNHLLTSYHIGSLYQVIHSPQNARNQKRLIDYLFIVDNINPLLQHKLITKVNSMKKAQKKPNPESRVLGTGQKRLFFAWNGKAKTLKFLLSLSEKLK